MRYSDQVYRRLVALAHREALEFPRESLPAASREAAVLIPLWPTDDGRVELALTRRSRALPTHRGHVSLPGGSRHDTDSSLLTTALRETAEELGLAPDRISIMGRLDDAWSFRGYHVVPYVGWLECRPVMTPDPREVEEVIIVDLETLQRSGSARPETGRGGRPRYQHVFRWEGGTVWGLTADILLELLLWIEGRESSRGGLRLEMLRRHGAG